MVKSVIDELPIFLAWLSVRHADQIGCNKFKGLKILS